MAGVTRRDPAGRGSSSGVRRRSKEQLQEYLVRASAFSNERTRRQFPARPLLISAPQRAEATFAHLHWMETQDIFVVPPTARSDAFRLSSGTNLVQRGLDRVVETTPMNSQYPRPGSSESRSHTPSASQDMRATAGDTASKIADAAREAGGQAKQAASSLASDATKQAKGFLNKQVTAGADMVDHVVDSARIAAENLEQEAPQLAGLVRSVADRAENFSQDLRGQTVEDLIQTASDFTRKQPALVFGLASLAGFLAFRIFKSAPPEHHAEHEQGSERFERGAGQFQGGQFRGGQFHGA
jgi:hypothetical protein